ncbi:hypothetical protein D3C76_1573670 [compost metagenome]
MVGRMSQIIGRAAVSRRGEQLVGVAGRHQEVEIEMPHPSDHRQCGLKFSVATLHDHAAVGPVSTRTDLPVHPKGRIIGTDECRPQCRKFRRRLRD